MASRTVTERDYARLLAVRTRLRQFEAWSADQAATQGLTAHQHQLLLAVRGHTGASGPTIGQVADYLMVRHNTAVELADRVQELGLVSRTRDDDDHRVVRLQLTAQGRHRLRELAGAHVEELSRLARMIDSLVGELDRRH